MEPIRGSVRRLASLIALGCLMGAATAAGVALVSAAPASAASCSAEVANVEGGRLSSWYGVSASVYVNTEATVNAYNYGFVRSLAVIVDNNNWVEIGWSAHIAGTTSPQVFAEWDNNGNGGYKNYNNLNYGTNYGFTIENYGQIKIWRFYFGGTLLGYSPTMTFNSGQPIGNSERNNWCQSLWTNMYNLNDYTSSRTWEGSWDDWAFCLNSSIYSTGNPYYMHKNSSTQLTVTTSSSGKMC
jgi:hypothetical protein